MEHKQYEFNVVISPSGERISDVRGRIEIESFMDRKEQAGYQNNSKFNLDGSIDIIMDYKKDDKVRMLRGTAKVIKHHNKKITV